MTKKKKTAQSVIKDTMIVGMGGVTMGLVGGAVQSQLPVGVANPLIASARVTSKFAPITMTIGMSSVALNQLNELNKPKRKKK